MLHANVCVSWRTADYTRFVFLQFGKASMLPAAIIFAVLKSATLVAIGLDP